MHLNVQVSLTYILCRDNHQPIMKIPLGTNFIVDDNYEFIKQIGDGAYGVVCAALDKKKDLQVAIKKV